MKIYRLSTALEKIKNENPIKVLLKCSKKLNNNKQLVIEIVKRRGCALKYVYETLTKDKDVVLLAVNENPLALRYASEEMQNDKDVASAALKLSELAYGYISEDLKKDKDIIEIYNQVKERKQIISNTIGREHNIKLEGLNQKHLKNNAKQNKNLSIENNQQDKLNDREL